MRVRLKHGLSVVEASGLDLRVSPPSAFFETEPRSGMHRVRINRARSGTWLVRWDGSKVPERIRAERLWVRGEMLRLGLESTPYDLEVYPQSKRGLDVIARLELETYLHGVLPAEMPISWPIESLKAQTIAARSFVLRQTQLRRARPFDVESTITDQVYKFREEARQNPEVVAKLDRAIDETRGQVLKDRRGHTLMAYYSADCGCQSEDPKFIWGNTERKVDSFESVKDPTCHSRRPTNWNLTLGRAEVREKLLAGLNLPTESNLKSLNVGGRTPSGRVAVVVAAVEVAGSSQSVVVNAQEFRRIFGFQRVQSADFSLRWFGDELQITGVGSGHGVGLCQRGARALAEEGMDYRKILKTYYPRATLRL